ncbi:MAG: MerR family transcriptional regulator [Austwickia sp.]|jgi:DNA-binding transcriptional MerR regulator|nr:MAG: MerR family transcriptional regulator [Austwickia sp.]
MDNSARGARTAVREPDPAGDLADPGVAVGIADVAAATGLTRDTLRWYEREGLIPAVSRGGDGRRRYDAATVRLIELLLRLRRTGMPVADMKRFVELLGEGAASHGRRMALLQAQRLRVLAVQRQLADDLAAIDAKIQHYAHLIDAGQDCGERPIDNADLRDRQRRTR